MAVKSAAAASAELHRFWDFAVRAHDPDGRDIGFGFLLNGKAALLSLTTELEGPVRLTTLVSELVVDAELVDRVGSFDVARLTGPLEDGIALPDYGELAAATRETVLIIRDTWAAVPFDGDLVPRGAPDGAPVVIEGRVAGVVLDGGVQPTADLGDALVSWAPEVRYGALEVPFPLDDATQYSPSCWDVVRRYDALVRDEDAGSPVLMWIAFVAAGRAQRDKSETAASFIAGQLPKAVTPSARRAARPVLDRLLTVEPVFSAAWAIRDRTTSGARIHLRHLAGALFVTSSGMFSNLGGDPESFRTEFLEFVEREVPEDDLDAWREILAAPAATSAQRLGRSRAGYNADAVGKPGELTDELAVSTEVETLCDVLAARDASPPLSVGLFGRWGAGKSYFMGLMQQRMQALASAARTAEAAQQESAYCTDIVQITFNAWHYMDANLWASLAVRIFEGISDSDAGDVDGAARGADTAALLTKLRKRESELATIDAKIAVAADDDRVKQAAEKLGLEEPRREVVGFLAEVSRFRAFWRVLRAKGAIVLLVFVVATVAVAALWRVGLPRLVALLPLLGSIAAAVGLAARRSTQVLKSLNDVLDNVGLEPADVAKERQAKDREIKDLKQQLAALDRRRALYDFVLERAGSEEYRRHFGLISLVRDDFEKLAQQLANDAPGRRIVLYIDDLDRCPPDRVVEVLQAVHLLLAFPLFVVVVGVDPRWLLRSLERHYEDVLSPDDTSWQTTPQNYLEKIFQIPFALRPMDASGFGKLVDAMFVHQPPSSEKTKEPSEAAVEETPPEPAGTEPEPKVSGGVTRNVVERPAAQSNIGPTPQAPLSPPVPTIDPNPAALQVTAEEVAFIRSVATLVETPRETRRLVNLYRLLRASRPSTEEIERFTRERDYEVVVTLLAVLVGHPRRASALFDRIRSAQPSESWSKFVASLDGAESTREWVDLARDLAAISGAATTDAPALDRYQAWVDVVERYSFDTVLTARPAPPAPKAPAGRSRSGGGGI